MNRLFSCMLTLAILLPAPLASAGEPATGATPPILPLLKLRAAVQTPASWPASEPTSQPVNAAVPLLVDTPVSVSAPPVEEPPPPPKPFYKRWWFWTAVGAAVAIVVVGSVAGTRKGDERVPAGESFDTRSFHD